MGDKITIEVCLGIGMDQLFPEMIIIDIEPENENIDE